MAFFFALRVLSCNQPKSLSGIETATLTCWEFINPIQIAINLNPYQGLKQVYSTVGIDIYNVAINLNPYQGLKNGSSNSA